MDAVFDKYNIYRLSELWISDEEMGSMDLLKVEDDLDSRKTSYDSNWSESILNGVREALAWVVHGRENEEGEKTHDENKIGMKRNDSVWSQTQKSLSLRKPIPQQVGMCNTVH